MQKLWWLKMELALKEHYDNLSKDLKKYQLNLGAYKTGLESVEARLVVYKKNKDIFEENIKMLKLDIRLRDNALTKLRNKLEKAEKERDEIKITFEKFEYSSKTLNKMLDSQVSDKYKTCVGYHAVPPLYTGNFMPSKLDLILVDVDEYFVSESVTSVPAVATNEAKTNIQSSIGGSLTDLGFDSLVLASFVATAGTLVTDSLTKYSSTSTRIKSSLEGMKFPV
nr:hypothetical protein [Tanacetum cinerariifolium]